MSGALTRAAGGGTADGSPFRRNIRLFLSSRLSTVSTAVVLAFVVLAINVASQGLRDAFDPKFHD